jgi:hypothetical protein
MKVKKKEATGVLKKLIDEFEALPEAEQKHIMRCTACEVPECNEFTRSLCGYAFKHPRAYGMVSD